MHEVYKFSIYVILLFILSCICSKFVTLSCTVILVTLYYYLDWESQRTVGDKVINLYLKVRNSKSNVQYTNSFGNNAHMHNSSGINNSLWWRKNGSSQSPNRSPIHDISRSLEPKITSTPIPYWQQIDSNMCTPPRVNTKLTPTRYSLSSDVSLCRRSLDKGQSVRSPAIQNVSGPLLASTHFHNVSTYMDSKSPGLSSRVVQYHNASEYKPTHQIKYDKAGIFPIVHLFKKDIPVVSPKPKRVTVRLANPDIHPISNSEYDKLLLEGALQDPIKTNPLLDHSSTESDVGTRSVLDALKEISRKRIHSSEEPDDDIIDNTKRQRKDALNGQKDQNKRTRDESPSGSPQKNASNCAKRTCVVDPITASLTSTNRYFYEQLEKGTKRKATNNLSKNSKKKITETHNVETQTASEEISVEETIPASKVSEKSTETDDITKVTTDSCEKQISQENPQNTAENQYQFDKIFDDKPLEIMRKNKLATLLGSLAGKKAVLISSEDILKSPVIQTEKKPVSIISPQNKAKHDKHVTFNLPEVAPLTMATKEKEPEVPDTIKPSIDNTNSEDPPTSKSEPTSVPTFNFGQTSSPSAAKSSTTTSMFSPSVTNTSFTIDKSSESTVNKTTTLPVPSNNIVKLMDTPSSVNISSSPSIPTSSTTSTSPGGFKFDLKPGPLQFNIAKDSSLIKPITSSTGLSNTTATPTEFFKIPTPISTASSTVSNKPSLFSTVETSKSDAASPVMFQFKTSPAGISSSTATTTATFSISSAAATPTFKFGSAEPTTTSSLTLGSSGAFKFGNTSTPFTTTSSTSAVTSSATFKSGPAVTSLATFSSASSTPFSFGDGSAGGFSFKPSTTPSQTMGKLFESSNVQVTTSSNDTSSKPGATKPFSFLSTGTSAGELKSAGSNLFSSTTPSSIFGSTTTAPVVSSAVPSFGGSSFGTTTSSAGITASGNIFGGIPSTIPSIFGTNAATTTSAFGTSGSITTPTFGNSLNTATTAQGFTTLVATTSVPTFGNTLINSTSPPAFGTTTTTSTPLFGTNTTTTTSAAAFGINKPALTFGGSNTNIFGSDNNSAFSTNTTNFVTPTSTSLPASGFGSSSSSFGAATISSFLSNLNTNFGIPKQEMPNTFAPAPPAFGPSAAPPKTDSTPAFGTSLINNNGTPSFMNANNSNTTPAFGAGFGNISTNSVFAKPTPNAFGPSQTGTFGAASNTPSFNSGNIFGATNASQANGPFNSSNPPPTTNAAFTFGAGNNASSAGVFSFGGGSDSPKPGGFSFGNANPPFGSNQPPAFGPNPAESFSSQFGSAAGSFSIGSGSTTSNKANRTQLKALRRRT